MTTGPTGGPEPRRGRDVSEELTEVRTVLSRAINARDTLRHWRDGDYGPRGGRWNQETQTRVGGSVLPDVDVNEMINAMEGVIILLERWRRTGRPRKADT